tara:strand:- start:223 stop:399 length:177 start_codon:yes stop_codon:yes gene_type:complete
MPSISIDFEMDELETPISITIARPDLGLMFFPQFDPDPGEEAPETEEETSPLRAVGDE